jgi:RIO kinase 1
MPRHKLWSDEDPDDVPSYAGSTEPDWSFPAAPPTFSVSDDPIDGDGDRWSTWDLSTAGERGPAPYPEWVVTDLGAVDVELGVLKTGKEADVHLVRRAVPGTGGCLLAAKRYRDTRHRQFHRDAGYQEGRRVRRSRETRAMRTKTSFGRELLSGQWARAEFDALCTLWTLGAVVPYPVQVVGTELLLEFVGDEDGTAAPRLAEIPARGTELDPLWEQVAELLVVLARAGWAHGDLSAYNLLVDGARVVMIDLPQVVDVVGNPQGPSYLDRDARNVATWFTGRGRPVETDALLALLRAEARIC